MGSKGYTTAQMSEAIALATVIGASAAGDRLHIQPRTIRKWCEMAGRAPADSVTRTDWQALGELARAKVAIDLSEGKLTTVQKATVAAIADRNAIAAPPPPEPPTEVEVWADQLEAELAKHYGEDSDLALVTVLQWLEDGSLVDAPTVPECMSYLRSIGDLHEHRARRRAEDLEANAAQTEKNRQAAQAWAMRSMDEETKRVIAAAEQWIREHSPSTVDEVDA